LTGSGEYNAAVARSWTYCLNHPAWEEEGWGSGSDYYRIYNCGWGMRAEMMYRRATGDESHRNYGLTCAQFLVNNPIDLYVSVNFYCTAWAIGNLYEYAEDIGDDTLKAQALARAATIKSLAESAPVLYISGYSWAMSGGATVWGLHNSYFQEHPGEEKAWMTTYASYLPEMIGPSASWDNAWNAWFMLGHYAAYHGTGDDAWADKFEAIAANLVAQDTDGDGGIPPSQNGTSDGDHTWVTSYLCYMGMDRILRDLSVTELAAKPVVGAVEVSWEPFEYAAPSYNVYREMVGRAGRPRLNADPLTGDPPYELVDDDVTPGTDYRYYVEGVGVTGHSVVSEPVTVTAGVPPHSFSLAQNYPNPCADRTTIEFSLPAAGNATLRVYDLAGRELYRDERAYSAGKQVVTLDIQLPRGVYIYQIERGEDAAARAMVVDY
jgi:hypothetical protein